MKLLRLMMQVTLLLSSAAYAFAQQPSCTLKQAPKFNGFQLGMTFPELKDSLADSSMLDSKITATNNTGAQAVRISGAELKDEYAEGIDDVNLTFVDKRLAVVRMAYHTGAGNWFGAQDFFKQVSEKLGLPQPPTSTSSGGRGSDKYKLECAGFTVTLVYSFGVSPNVTIADAEVQKLVNERREKNPDEGIQKKRVDIKQGRLPPVPPFQSR